MKKLLCVFLVLAMFAGLVTMSLAAEEPAGPAEAPMLDGGGPVGDPNVVEWSIDDGIISIGGSGPTYDFPTSEYDMSPFTMFMEYDIEMTSAMIGEGVTTIGDRLFSGCSNIAAVYIPASVTRIGTDAFSGCTALKDVYYAGSEDQWSALSIEDSSGPLAKAAIHYSSPIGEINITPLTDSWSMSYGDVDYTIKDGILRLTGSGSTGSYVSKEYTGTGTWTWHAGQNIHISPIREHKDSFSEVFIGKGVTCIGENLLYGCTVNKVYYEGDQAEWDDLTILEGNSDLASASLYLNSVEPGTESETDPSAGTNNRIEPTVELQDVSTDPGVYSFERGHDSDETASEALYAGGQKIATWDYFTLATGENSGEYAIVFTFDDGSSKLFVFEAQENAVYFLTYSYRNILSTESGSYTVTVTGPGGEKQTEVSSSGDLTGGSLSIALVRHDEPAPEETPEPTATPEPTPPRGPEDTPEPTAACPVLISLADAKVTVKKQTYTGEPLTPKVTVKLNGKTLKKGTDYTVSYKKNTAAGIATVTVTGKGDYTGTAKGTFKILTAKTAIKTIKNVSTGVKLTWKKVTGAKGYEISRKEAGGKWTSLGTVTKASFTDTTAQAGTKYAYRVRCVTKDGATPVSGYSKSKTITFVAPPALKSAKNVKSGIKVTWTESAGASKYAVYRKAAGGSWEPLGVTKKTAYTDKTAESGIKYAYRVCCVKKDGATALSAYSGTKTVTRK